MLLCPENIINIKRLIIGVCSQSFKAGSVLDSRLTLNGYYDKMKSRHYHDISFDKDNFAFYANMDNTFHISSEPNLKAEFKKPPLVRTAFFIIL